MLANVIVFAHNLRRAGIPVSLVEAIDAATALQHIDVRRREQVKAALAGTMVKSVDHRPVFDAHFDLYFSALADHRVPEPADAGGRRAGGGLLVPREDLGATGDDADYDFLEILIEALLRADEAALRALAETAVRQFGHVDADANASVRYYMHRVLRELDLGWVLQQARRRARAEAEHEFAGELDVRELERRVAAFRERLEKQVQRDLTRQRGPEAHDALDEMLRTVEGMDFLDATPEQLRRMRQAVRPLARRLAAKLAQRRKRRHRGRLDMRRTVRRSLSTGGVPFDPAFRHRRESRPDLFLVADVSGSVAQFAEFTIGFLSAMTEEFPKLRCFIFVDGAQEVTEHVRRGVRDVKHLIARSPDLSRDGHSHHAKALDQLWRKHGADLSGSSTVIFTGDARNNHRVDDAGLATLRRIQGRVRQLYWLNPEPRGRWGRDDSLMPEFGRICDGVFEVRNLAQLQDFVLAIA